MSDDRDQRGTGYYRNWTSFAGILLMIGGFFIGLYFFVLEMLTEQAPPYVGVLYLAATGLVVAGFIVIPIGMVMERHRQRSQHTGARLSAFRLDLDRPEHRYAALGLLASAGLVAVLVGVGSYKSFQATESIRFCGQLCHSVMSPEWVRYNDSPHARVRCAACHIGSGADWFVKSKLSGIRRVWATLASSFPRPIPTPITDLRPARETCEECHWRRRFIGYKESVYSYFLSDEENSLHQLRMLVKIGGEKTTFLRGSGIHYHMLIASRIEYIATDERRHEIRWVRVTRGDGSVTEFDHEEKPLGPEERASHEVRIMDCMDCHNRPAHQFPTPVERVNQALEDGSISRDLPHVKVQAVRALDDEYANAQEAAAGIANKLRDFYRREHPELFDDRPHDLTRTIKEVQRIYRETIFPEMKANWAAYPDNIGHRDSPGCFRCHNDELVSEDGQTIFTTCNKCHLILAQGQGIDQVNVDLDKGLAFVHPEDFDTIDEYTVCWDCHDGGYSVYE